MEVEIVETVRHVATASRYHSTVDADDFNTCSFQLEPPIPDGGNAVGSALYFGIPAPRLGGSPAFLRSVRAQYPRVFAPSRKQTEKRTKNG